SIKVAEGNAVYDSREGCNALIETESNTLLAGCKGTKIPTSVTGIGDEAFSGCSGLTGIEIPTNVTFIDRYAFFDCSGLTGIKIPASVTSISASAFSGCSENLIIYGVSGSEAERYAASNGIMFKEVDMPSQGGDVPSQDGDVPSQGGNTPVVPKAEDISQAAITLEKTSYTYDGKPKTPSVTVSFGAKTLVPHTDYTVSYHNNTKVGTANVTVTGKGNYTGSKSVTFAIVKAPEQEQQGTSITCKKTLYHVAYGKKPFKINASSKSKLSYTSNKPKIATVGKSTGKVTIKGTGVATITVKAGNKSVKVAIKVSPKRPSVKSIQAAKGKKLAVKWAKDKMASGYQVQVSTAKNFKQNLKTKKVTKTSYTFTKLKTGKRYYVRIRSYKKTNKETLYGAWSKVKQSRKVKK
ncbi:MAG: leucine-rich repeat protein, partial [Lachnospiraceae bacterium]|nr:leucine-rich repeat protein [Lachnospiraceae bacterium]